MPNSIGACTRCGSTMYLEDGVAGACTCAEGGLRVLLARMAPPKREAPPVQTPMRVRTAAVPAVAQGMPNRNGRILPDIPADMFLSPQGRSEYQAATRPASISMGTMVPYQLCPRCRPGTRSCPHGEESRPSRLMTPAIDPNDPADLDPSIWLAGTGLEGMEMTPSFVAEDNFPVAFDSDIDTEAGPSRYVAREDRFRADQPPPHVAFVGERQTGHDGQVVARRTPSGAFMPTEAAARTTQTRPVRGQEAPPRIERPVTPSPVQQRQYEAQQREALQAANVRKAVDKVTISTAYDRLGRDDFLDD